MTAELKGLWSQEPIALCATLCNNKGVKTIDHLSLLKGVAAFFGFLIGMPLVIVMAACQYLGRPRGLEACPACVARKKVSS